MIRKVSLVSFVLGSALAARADIKLPAIFSDHMVLQRSTRVPVWGWADPGEKVTVTLAAQSHTAYAGDDGSWRVNLSDLSPGPPTTLTVSGRNALVINDVLFAKSGWVRANRTWP